MLFFIPFDRSAERNQCRFQYISCYSLSLFQAAVLHNQGTFQYISCYSLSIFVTKRPVKLTQFQYISCYSLSRTKTYAKVLYNVSIHLMLFFIALGGGVVLYALSFNTSHVILYHDWGNHFITEKHCFNTSHVILYRLKTL